MNRSFLTFASAALLTVSASLPVAASRKDSRADTTLLRDVALEAHRVAYISDQLEAAYRAPTELRGTYISDLEQTRREINQAGDELRRLESDRPALTPWERQALDQVEPLLASVARNETRLILYYNEHRPNLANPEFKHLIEQVRADSRQAARLLDDYFKLDKVRKSESRILKTLGNPGE